MIVLPQHTSVKHLNPRQGITIITARAPRSTGRTQRVKHLNPRQGITIVLVQRVRSRVWSIDACETPKSPPGDYNAAAQPPARRSMHPLRVKHLNPRQGITTELNNLVFTLADKIGVKHLNPRQGITTGPGPAARHQNAFWSVKHLNLRQGITTALQGRVVRHGVAECETPKSPPGDYNSVWRGSTIRRTSPYSV